MSAHPVAPSIFKALRHRCPRCAEGPLYRAYLKVNPACSACGLDFAQYPADDGPAYLTILLVGHLIVAPLFFFPVVWETSPLISLPILLSALTVVVLAGLPRVKGGWIGLMYALDVKASDHKLHTADAAD